MFLLPLIHQAFSWTEDQCRVRFQFTFKGLSLGELLLDVDAANDCHLTVSDLVLYRRSLNFLVIQKNISFLFVLSWRKPWAIPMFFRSNESPHQQHPRSTSNSSTTHHGPHAKKAPTLQLDVTQTSWWKLLQTQNLTDPTRTLSRLPAPLPKIGKCPPTSHGGIHRPGRRAAQCCGAWHKGHSLPGKDTIRIPYLEYPLSKGLLSRMLTMAQTCALSLIDPTKWCKGIGNTSPRPQTGRHAKSPGDHVTHGAIVDLSTCRDLKSYSAGMMEWGLWQILCLISTHVPIRGSDVSPLPSSRIRPGDELLDDPSAKVAAVTHPWNIAKTKLKSRHVPYSSIMFNLKLICSGSSGLGMSFELSIS